MLNQGQTLYIQCIYIDSYIYVHIYKCSYIYIYTCVYSYTHTFIYIYIHINTQMGLRSSRLSWVEQFLMMYDDFVPLQACWPLHFRVLGAETDRLNSPHQIHRGIFTFWNSRIWQMDIPKYIDFLKNAYKYLQYTNTHIYIYNIIYI